MLLIGAFDLPMYLRLMWLMKCQTDGQSKTYILALGSGIVGNWVFIKNELLNDVCLISSRERGWTRSEW